MTPAQISQIKKMKGKEVSDLCRDMVKKRLWTPAQSQRVLKFYLDNQLTQEMVREVGL